MIGGFFRIEPVSSSLSLDPLSIWDWKGGADHLRSLCLRASIYLTKTRRNLPRVILHGSNKGTSWDSRTLYAHIFRVLNSQSHMSAHSCISGAPTKCIPLTTAKSSTAKGRHFFYSEILNPSDKEPLYTSAYFLWEKNRFSWNSIRAKLAWSFLYRS